MHPSHIKTFFVRYVYYSIHCTHTRGLHQRERERAMRNMVNRFPQVERYSLAKFFKKNFSLLYMYVRIYLSARTFLPSRARVAAYYILLYTLFFLLPRRAVATVRE